MTKEQYALPHLNVDNMVKRNKMQQIVCLAWKIMLDRSYANVGLDPIPELVLSTPSHLSTPTHLQIDPRYKKIKNLPICMTGNIQTKVTHTKGVFTEYYY